MSNFQSVKLKYFFKILDLNSNNELQMDDFAVMAEKVRKRMGFEEGGNKHQMVAQKAVKFYRTLLSDVQPGDFKKINEQEWVSFFKSKVIDTQDDVTYDLYKELIFNFMFDFFDENRDGFIQIKEYAAFYEIFGIDDTYLEEAFELIDRNGRNKLSRYDLMLSLDEFLKSDDPDDHGNWVFGYWESKPHTGDLF